MRRVELVTAARMRRIEAAAMASGEVSGAALMERAGARVVEAIGVEWAESGPGSSAVVVCGPGNNGGDGFVVARLLHEAGWAVRVLAMPTARRGADASAARAALRRAGVRAAPLTYDAFRWGPEADLYVDALFGTGARGPATGGVGEIMRFWAGSGGDEAFFGPRTVAVDLPSGLDADSGRVPGADGVPDSSFYGVPAARLTVTFDSPKPGHVLADGPELCGRVVVADIGLARWRERDADGSVAIQRIALLAAGATTDGLASPRTVADGRPPLGAPRSVIKRQGHKYDHGHALVLGGGVGRGGAARLAARAALRVGAGAVTVGCPPAAVIENAARLDAVMIARVADADALRAVIEEGRIGALCLGMGLGRGERERALVAAALASGLPAVLDADAVRMLGEDGSLRDGLHERCLLTPHMGEFRTLCPDLAEAVAPATPPAISHGDATDLAAMRERQAAWEAWRAALAAERAPMPSKIDVAREAAARLGCAVLLKGPDTVIATPPPPARRGARDVSEGAPRPKGFATVHAAVGDRAVPWLATAGAGDVLAGIAAGLMARHFDPHGAGAMAAWLHAEAARGLGPGLIAEDLPDLLPAALRAAGA